MHLYIGYIKGGDLRGERLLLSYVWKYEKKKANDFQFSFSPIALFFLSLLK